MGPCKPQCRRWRRRRGASLRQLWFGSGASESYYVIPDQGERAQMVVQVLNDIFYAIRRTSYSWGDKDSSDLHVEGSFGRSRWWRWIEYHSEVDWRRLSRRVRGSEVDNCRSVWRGADYRVPSY